MGGGLIMEQKDNGRDCLIYSLTFDTNNYGQQEVVVFESGGIFYGFLGSVDNGTYRYGSAELSCSVLKRFYSDNLSPIEIADLDSKKAIGGFLKSLPREVFNGDEDFVYAPRTLVNILNFYVSPPKNIPCSGL